MSYADDLNAQVAYQRECGHNVTEEYGDGSIECLDCGLSGRIKWDDLPPLGYEYVDSKYTPMGLELREIKKQ